MQRPSGITRVILVILDGLRADAIPLFPLPHLQRLALNGAYTLAGRTVLPSITASALTSLLTGVPPRVHGVVSEQIAGHRSPRTPLAPLPGGAGPARPPGSCLPRHTSTLHAWHGPACLPAPGDRSAV